MSVKQTKTIVDMLTYQLNLAGGFRTEPSVLAEKPEEFDLCSPSKETLDFIGKYTDEELFPIIFDEVMASRLYINGHGITNMQWFGDIIADPFDDEPCNSAKSLNNVFGILCYLRESIE